MTTNLYVVEKQSIATSKPVINSSIQKIFENHNNYESNPKQNETNSNKNVIQTAFTDVVFFERVHKQAFKNVRNDPEYNTAENESRQLFSQLESSLSDEQKKLLQELESAWDNKYGIFLEHCYCQGIADSPMIHKQLEEYGVSVVKEDEVSASFNINSFIQ